eukprot:760220-Hanusia_phi.AAC.4
MRHLNKLISHSRNETRLNDALACLKLLRLSARISDLLLISQSSPSSQSHSLSAEIPFAMLQVKKDSPNHILSPSLSSSCTSATSAAAFLRIFDMFP